MKVAVGDKVGILNQSFGWGPIKKGDFGIISAISGDSISVNVPGKTSTWTCKEKDIIKCLPRTAMNCPASVFINTVMNSLEERIAQEDSSAKKVYKKIKLPDTDIYNTVTSLVESVQFMGSKTENPYMIIQTKRCTIPYTYNGVPLKVDVGRFKCTVTFGRYDVRIVQLDPTKIIDHYPHPHISDDRPCLGSYYQPLKHAVDEYNICQVILVLLDFLNSCSTGWYRSVIAWMPVEEQIKHGIDTRERCSHCDEVLEDCECSFCHECENITDECTCHWCNECDNHEENCTCLRCPESMESLEDDIFPDEYCRKCPYLVKDLDDDLWKCEYVSGQVTFETGLDGYSPVEDRETRYAIRSNGALYTRQPQTQGGNNGAVPTNQQSNAGH